MANDIIKEFLAAQTALLQEKGRIEQRLAQINRALSQGVPPSVVAAAVGGTKAVVALPAAKGRGGRRTISAAGRARIAAAARARWARTRAGKGGGKAGAVAPKKAKRQLSAEGRAKIIAATKARWERMRAAKAVAAAPVPPAAAL